MSVHSTSPPPPHLQTTVPGRGVTPLLSAQTSQAPCPGDSMQSRAQDQQTTTPEGSLHLPQHLHRGLHAPGGLGGERRFLQPDTSFLLPCAHCESPLTRLGPRIYSTIPYRAIIGSWGEKRVLDSVMGLGTLPKSQSISQQMESCFKSIKIHGAKATQCSLSRQTQEVARRVTPFLWNVHSRWIHRQNVGL